ncbi:endonuclease domain-containing protein [Methylomonas koyamae]|uniref:endonuclease domain-containing protein n=1 Tax=Methylomonas koyamae TaxID=702114 RepID=UPI0009EEDAFA|nr:endonuclease domain-containing protein [Methylomonas koyamae]
MAKSEETIFNRPQYRGRRVELRKNPTEPEKRFWQAVRGKQLGVKFRRQHGIGHYIVDFYCPEWQLVVELDGDSHFHPEAQTADTERDGYLQSLGLRVLRFTNQEVMQNLEGVLMKVMESNPTPALPLPGEGESSSPCEGGGREGVVQSNKELGNASTNPTPTLPLPGEGENAACESESHVEGFSSPCEGGGREGVVQTNQEMAGYLKELGYARA